MPVQYHSINIYIYIYTRIQYMYIYTYIYIYFPFSSNRTLPFSFKSNSAVWAPPLHNLWLEATWRIPPPHERVARTRRIFSALTASLSPTWFFRPDSGHFRRPFCSIPPPFDPSFPPLHVGMGHPSPCSPSFLLLFPLHLRSPGPA